MIKNINEGHISDQVQRTFRIVKVLAGHEFEGMSNSEIADKADVPRSSVSRAIDNLQLMNWVEPLPSNSKLYRLAPGIVQIANTVAQNLTLIERQVQQDVHNYTRLAV